MVDEKELFRELDSTGLGVKNDRNKRGAAFQSRSNDRYLYLNRDLLTNGRIVVIIDPNLSAPKIPGAHFLGIKFRSHMTEFPSRMNKGKTPCHYGHAFELDNSAALRDFLSWFTKLN